MKWSYAKVFMLGLTVFHLLGSAGAGKGGLEVHAAEVNPVSSGISVEARYSSNKIIFPVTEGASGYDVYRAESEEGEFVKITASPLTAAANQTEITYIDTGAGTGTHYWYKVIAVMTEGDPVELTPVQDIYATGLDAVHMHAEQDQYHRNFAEEGNTYFDGNRVEIGTQEDIDRIKNLKNGTILISYKATSMPTNTRRAILSLTSEDAVIPVSAGQGSILTAGKGALLMQEYSGGDSFIRADFGSGFRSNYANSAPVGEWATFAIICDIEKTVLDKKTVSAYNGNAITSGEFDNNNVTGFFSHLTDLTNLSVGAAVKNNALVLPFKGDIAYITITDEILTRAEINQYTEAVTEAMTEAEALPLPGVPEEFQATPGDGEVVLDWSTAEHAAGYEVCIGEEDWILVEEGTTYTFSGLENGREYTFQLRAVNGTKKGEAVSVTAIPEREVQAPTAPANLQASAGDGQVVLSWSASQGEVTKYQVSYDLGDSWIDVEEGTAYTVTGLTNGISYTFKVRAVNEGGTGREAEVMATPMASVAAAPVFDAAAGTYTQNQTITITTETEGAEIYYTINGSDPTSSDLKYTGPFQIDRRMVIRAVAVKDGMEDSQVVKAAYRMDREFPFTDVEQNNGWKHNSVKYVWDNSIMNGISGTSWFQADETLTRAMFATVLYRMAGQPEVEFKNVFKDVEDGKWYSDAIVWANQNHIVQGIGDGLYGVDDKITREQIAKMLYLYAELSGYDVTESQPLSAFTDEEKVSNWAVKYMKWATAVKMITGKPNTDGVTYAMDAGGDATRGECAAMLMRFEEKYIPYE